MGNHIKHISIDAGALIRSEKNKTLRERAITDLLEGNAFGIEGVSGPYQMHVAIADSKFQMQVTNENGQAHAMTVPLSALRTVIKDYHIICESYYDAIKTADPRRTEAIDMGRRGVHNEGAQILEDLLESKINTDFETLRKLFSLIYVLQIK